MADWISALPDELICHVLSFLRTEDAVATTVLSKRWRHLWRSVPALDFSSIRDGKRFFDFVIFVNSVLLVRDAGATIKKFRLEMPNAHYLDSDCNWVSELVNLATKRRLEHLDLYVNSELPISILSCRTLVILKLKWFQVKRNFSTQLPSLKTLDLDNVEFPSDRHLIEFLEDLQLHSIQFYSEVSVNFAEPKSLSLPKLTRANIYLPRYNFPLKPFSNVKFLSAEIKQEHYGIPSFHNLTHLELIIRDYEFLVGMLNHCPKLQSLSFLILNWRSTPKNWTDPVSVPKCLSSNLKTCSFRNCDYEDLEVELQVARYILGNASVLQTMTFLTRGPISQRKIKMIRQKLFSGRTSPSKCRLIVHQM